MQKELMLSLGMIDLSFAYITFTNQEYFSGLQMLILFILPLLAFILFVFPDAKFLESVKKKNYVIAFSSLLSLIIIYSGISFYLIPPGSFGKILPVVVIVAIAVLLSVWMMYLLGKFIKNKKHKEEQGINEYLLILIGALVGASLAFITMYGFTTVNWNGVDELAFNYYAAFLFLHGTNPYSASMQPILVSRNIFPTVQLNGTYEYAYDYPALSFLAYVPSVAIGIKAFLFFIAFLIFIAMLTSMLIYRSSGFENRVLVPISIWLFLSYTLVSISNTYLAVLFLIVAYLYREKLNLSGIALGLAAATTQLSWFALPFFYVITLKELKFKSAARQVLVSVASFLLVNSYFILISPKLFFSNIFGLFNANRVFLYGPNIMQFFVTFYPISFSYSTLLSALALVAAFLIFYFYDGVSKSLIAVAPAMIFFLAWRNISIYGISFIPLILAVYYAKEKHGAKSKMIVKNKLVVPLVILLMIIVAGIGAVYMHSIYVNKNIIRIESVTPVIYIQRSQSGLILDSLGALKIGITNNGNRSEPVSFYVVSRSPNNERYFLGYYLNPYSNFSNHNITLNYTLPLINNSTKLFVMAFNNNHIATKELDVIIHNPNFTTH